MKRLSFTLSILFSIIILNAQPPQAFKYQAVVRDASGDIITNQAVDLRISIHDDATPSGYIVYQETFSETTNQFGLVNLEIGNGIPTIGTFTGIDWGNNSKSLEVEIDATGGGSYVSMGTSELLSVPYSLYSDHSADAVWNQSANNIYYNDGDVGIGTSNPASDLHVYGSGIFRGTEGGVAIGTGPDYGSLQYNYSNGGFLNLALYQGKTIINGNVGLGTFDPVNAKLHLLGSSSYTGIIRMENTGTNGADCFMGATEQTWGSAENSFVVGHGTPSTSNIDFTINNYGWVGIGESDPAYPLHVKKNAYASWVAGIHNIDIDPGSHGLVVRADGGDPLWVQNNSGTLLSIKQSGQVGIGTVNPVCRLEVRATETYEVGIHGSSLNAVGVYATTASSTAYGIFAGGPTTAGYFNGNVQISGNVQITGNLSKGSGSFVIDHPLDPENKLLRHNFVESPENLLIYRGKAELDENGEARVELPDYFKALTKEEEASIHLTPVGMPFLTGADWNNDFSGIIIYGDPNRNVFWEVLADRDDPVIHVLGRPVEEEKGGENTLCEKGKLLYPEAYGYPETMGRDFEMKQLNKK